ncbi:MAG: hypothetical protein H6529_07000 [Nocardioides sp.]|nr:hypothetical protein [Nocardioidaceae bacterium]MCB8956216.1 hypothetical protein [Nocardioides sp.]
MRTTLAAAALSAAALTLVSAGAAHAELYGIDDPEDTFHGSDIRALSVRNGQENVTVTTVHDNLVRRAASGSAETVFVDTDRHDRGPEFVFVAGLYEGTDYLLRATDGFDRSSWGEPVENGDYVLRVRYRKDVARVVMSRAALGNPDEVRVAVRASGTRTDGTSHGLLDWVGERRSFTPWLSRG